MLKVTQNTLALCIVKTDVTMAESSRRCSACPKFITKKTSSLVDITLNHLSSLADAWVCDIIYSQVELLARLPSTS